MVHTAELIPVSVDYHWWPRWTWSMDGSYWQRWQSHQLRSYYAQLPYNVINITLIEIRLFSIGSTTTMRENTEIIFRNAVRTLQRWFLVFVRHVNFPCGRDTVVTYQQSITKLLLIGYPKPIRGKIISKIALLMKTLFHRGIMKVACSGKRAPGWMNEWNTLL